MVARGEIWLIRLDPTEGSEIQKTRPCVIVSPPELNDRMQTVVVAPMTTAQTPLPFRIPVDFKGKSGLILLDQIRAVAKTRLLKRLGTVESETHRRVLQTLQEFFAE